MSQPAGPRVLVVQNARKGGLGRFADWWQEAGLALDVVHAYDGEPIPDLDDHDGLVLLGGGLMPDDDAAAPWLARERDVAVKALQSGIPQLGICLGGQLLAYVAGGSVRAEYGQPEAGSTVLTRRPEADQDVLFGDLEPTFRAIEHHVDQITELPPEAVWLASSDRCPYQAFRVGEHSWGLQFHPEVDLDRIRAWNPDNLIEQGFDPEQVIDEAAEWEPTSAVVWRAFADRFARVVRS